MRKLIFASFLIIIVVAFISVNSFALDKFMTYRNISSAQSTDEDVPAVPEVNFALKQGYINTYVLIASTNKAITVPTGSKFAVFASPSDIWVRVGGVAAIPSGDTTDGTGSELNPTARYLDTDTIIGVISESAAKISIMFYN